MKNHHIYSGGSLIIIGLVYVLLRVLGYDTPIISGFTTLCVTICILVFCFGEDY